jgi:D-alanine-D-alanine ligase-like ATP-grasp enzyme
MKRRLVKLPGAPEACVNPRSVVSARIETGGEQPFVVVHTDQGFAIGVSPLEQSVEGLLDDVVRTVRKGR